MKTLKFLTGIAVSLLVACAPQNRPPQTRTTDKVVPGSAEETQKLKEINAEIEKRTSKIKGTETREQRDVLNLQVLGNVLSIAFEKNDKNEIQKVLLYISSRANESAESKVVTLALTPDKEKKDTFTNKDETDAPEKYTVFIVKSENEKSKIVIYFDSKGGSAQGEVTIVERISKAKAKENATKKYIVTEGKVVREASEEQAKVIAEIEKQLSGPMAYTQLKLAAKDIVERKTLRADKVVIETSKLNNEEVEIKNNGDKIQNGTVKSLEAKSLKQIELQIEVDKVIVDFALTDYESLDQKVDSEQYNEWAEKNN